jgi:predicted RNase H-like nuclease
LNGQPIAYSKSSDRGRDFRLHLLSEALDDAEAHYRAARDESLLTDVRRDDVLDSMALAIAANRGELTTAPIDPTGDQPRIYYPDFEVPVVDGE